jgi:hypothetical protein
MISLPKTIGEVESLIRHQIQESIHLDYKASPALSPEKTNEIAKDVSAFANSDGGILIYGVEEDKDRHVPLKIDNGVDSKWSREWLEQIITSHISPKIEGIEITQIEVGEKRFVVCVKVPKMLGPHLASDKRFYKRFNFSSFPMEHYEIEDLRARRHLLPPLVSLDMETPAEQGFMLTLRNTGNFPARDLKFKWPESTIWPSNTPPTQFLKGIKFRAPGKIHRFILHNNTKFFDWKQTTTYPKFDIELSYVHGESEHRLVENFHFDVADFPGTEWSMSDIERVERPLDEIRDGIKDLKLAIENLFRNRSF